MAQTNPRNRRAVAMINGGATLRFSAASLLRNKKSEYRMPSTTHTPKKTGKMA
jgi:hypothetical protein